MLLNLVVHAPAGTAPDDPHALAAVDSAAALEATVWTAPTHHKTVTNTDGTLTFHYTTDAIPRTHPSVVTNSNAAPALQPPTIA